MEGNQTRFNEWRDSNIKKLVENCIRHQITSGFFTMFTRGLIAKKN